MTSTTPTTTPWTTPGRAAMSRQTKVFLTAAIVVAVAAAAFGGVWYWYAHPPVARYRPAIDAVAAGRVVPDGQGRFDLSKLAPGVAPRDQAFLARHGDGSFLVFFPTEYGKGRQAYGLLYTSRPLTPADTFTRDLAVGFDRRYVTVGTWPKLALDDRVDDHWYRVSYGEH